MGLICCRITDKPVVPTAFAENEVYDSTQDLQNLKITTNVIISGLPRSGKTLLWKNLIFQNKVERYPEFPPPDELSIACQTIKINSSVINVWDTSSDHNIQVKMILGLLNLHIGCIFFLVPLQASDEELTDAKCLIFQLLCEINLSNTKLVLLISIDDSSMDAENNLTESATSFITNILLQLDVVMNIQLFDNRFTWGIANVARASSFPLISSTFNELA